MGYRLLFQETFLREYETLNAFISLSPVVSFLLQQILRDPYQQSDTVTHLFTEAKTPPAIPNSPQHKTQGSAPQLLVV